LHHDDIGLGASHRAVLVSLYRGGDQTVPALARARPVSRQHIQILVNALLEQLLVEAIANPAHKSSPLIRLTRAGRARFEAMRAKERALLESMRLPATSAEMTATADTLRRLRERLRDSVAPAPR
jgi:DNA-binding MarR family transcriptional regulator